MFHERSEAVAEQALDILESLGVEEAAVLVTSGRRRQVRYSNNEIDVVKTWMETSMTLQVVKGRRVTVLETSDLREGGLRSFLRAAVERLERLPERRVYAPLPDGPFDYPNIGGLYDPKLEDPGSALVEAVETAIGSARRAGAKRVAGSLMAEAGHECLLTTGGVRVCERETRIQLEARAFVDPQSTGHGATCSRSLDGIDPERVGEEAGEDALLSSKGVEKVGPGRRGAVFGWSAMATLLGVFGSMASAMRVVSQMSPYADRLGTKVGSDLVNLADDPVGDGNYGARSFDLEGYPTRRNVIFEEGVLKTYLHNRITARMFGTRSTGNAGWVFPRAWHLTLDPGDLSEDELLEEAEGGLLVKNVTYLRFQNYLSGDFSAVIRDGVFLIRGGEPIAAVRGLRLSDNVLRMLESVRGLTRESRQVVHWWTEWGPSVTTPMMAVGEVGFTAATA